MNGRFNQAMNCVPTVLTMMVARFNPAKLSPGARGDDVIDKISYAMRSLDGSPGVSGLASMRTLGVLGDQLGLRLWKRPGIDLDELARALMSGQQQAMVIGDAYALPYARPDEMARAPYEDAGHVIAVTGFDRMRQLFMVNDPGQPARRATTMTPQELGQFVGYLNHNLDGGVGGCTIYVSAA
jgi:hypothetical protein